MRVVMPRLFFGTVLLLLSAVHAGGGLGALQICVVCGEVSRSSSLDTHLGGVMAVQCLYKGRKDSMHANFASLVGDIYCPGAGVRAASLKEEEQIFLSQCCKRPRSRFTLSLRGGWTGSDDDEDGNDGHVVLREGAEAKGHARNKKGPRLGRGKQSSPILSIASCSTPALRCGHFCDRIKLKTCHLGVQSTTILILRIERCVPCHRPRTRHYPSIATIHALHSCSSQDFHLPPHKTSG